MHRTEKAIDQELTLETSTWLVSSAKFVFKITSEISLAVSDIFIHSRQFDQFQCIIYFKTNYCRIGCKLFRIGSPMCERDKYCYCTTEMFSKCYSRSYRKYGKFLYQVHAATPCVFLRRFKQNYEKQNQSLQATLAVFRFMSSAYCRRCLCRGFIYGNLHVSCIYSGVWTDDNFHAFT